LPKDIKVGTPLCTPEYVADLLGNGRWEVEHGPLLTTLEHDGPGLRDLPAARTFSELLEKDPSTGFQLKASSQLDLSGPKRL
jgi:hypothetical protein